MRGNSLANRSFGAQFAAFEHELIWDLPDAGWVEFVGRKEFILRKTPFSNHYSDHRYLLPEDLQIPEGAYAELTVGRLRRERPIVDTRTGYVRFEREYYPVEAYQVKEPHIAKPLLSPDEFMARLVLDWRDAEPDRLDRAIALQLVSCPRDVYGTGGIGSQSFSLSSARSPLDNLRRTIARQLPVEFTRPHPKYEFEFIESRTRSETLAERRAGGAIEEVSYNFLRLVDPTWTVAPIQVPTILHNAYYAPRSRHSDPDFDVREFLLTALMIRPVVDDRSIEEIEKGLRLIREQVEPESVHGQAPFDPHAITRLSLALCRLELRTSIDEAAFRQGEHWFLEMYREFSDLRGSVFRPGKESWAPAQIKTSYADANLGPHDVDVLRAVMRIREESGKTWIPFAEIANSVGSSLTTDQVRTSLRRLVLAGRVLQGNNGTVYRPLVLE